MFLLVSVRDIEHGSNDGSVSKGIQDVCISALVMFPRFHVGSIQPQYSPPITEYRSSECWSTVVDEPRILDPNIAAFKGDGSTFSGKPLKEKASADKMEKTCHYGKLC